MVTVEAPDEQTARHVAFEELSGYLDDERDAGPSIGLWVADNSPQELLDTEDPTPSKQRKKPMVYVNTRTQYGVETIDQAETRKEAIHLLREYRLAFSGTGIPVYLSQRPDATWRAGE